MLSQSGPRKPMLPASVRAVDTGTVVSKRDWSIEFDTGKGFPFTTDGERKMYEIKDDLAIAGAPLRHFEWTH